VSFPLAEIWDLTAGDFNNDGRLDLAFTQRYNDRRIHIYLNNPLLGFLPAPGSPMSLSNEPFELESSDFNNDGNLDLAVHIGVGGSVFTYLGTGSGEFNWNPQLQFPLGPLTSVKMTADDFNKDGNEDLALTKYEFGQDSILEVRLGAGNGTFTLFSQLIPEGHSPINMISSDFNLDGNRDLVHGMIYGTSLRSLQNDGAGNFSAVFGGPNTPTATQNPVTEDFNNDGEADFASIITTGSIYVLLHGGCGPTLTAATNIGVSRCGPPVPKVLGTFVEDDYSPQQMTIEITSTLPQGLTISNLTATGGKQIVGLVDASPNTPLGTHLFYLKITNPEGQYDFGTASLNVVDGTQPLTLSQPQNMTVFNDPDQCGAIVNYITPQASGGCTPVSTVCSPISGSMFQLGATNVTCTATDQAGNQATKTFSVTVIDNQAPKFNGISDIVVNAAPGQCSAVVNFNITASDNCSAVPVTTNPPSGSVFPAGTTVVTATAIDAAGNGATATFNVTVNGSGPATITTPVASPAVLGPPNHKMRNATIDYAVTPGCGGPVNCALSVTSNEPVNGPDDGDAAPDWEVVNPHKVRLRAERSGSGTGRIYTITITCTDAAGYQTTKTVTVTVPLDN
jgi:HYR domain/FG-GAP-like repeat